MQDNSLVGSIDELPTEMIRARIRFGRRALPRPLGRLALLLAAAVGLPWLPILVEPPANRPMQRLPGVTGSALYRMAFDPVNRILATIDERGCVAVQPVDEAAGAGRRIDVPGFAWAIAFSPDGRRLAVGQKNADVLFLTTNPGVPTRASGPPVRYVTHLAFAPDGRTLAIACATRPGTILIWDIEARRTLLTLTHGNPPRSTTALAFAPDGASLAASGYDSSAVLIWDVLSGRLVRRLADTGQSGLAYSPDGRALAVVGHGVRIWNPSTGALIRTIAEGGSFSQATFSPDGRRLATASLDGIACVWDVADGRERMRLDGQAQVIRDVAFSASGHALLAIGSDGDIRRWDLNRPDMP